MMRVPARQGWGRRGDGMPPARATVAEASCARHATCATNACMPPRYIAPRRPAGHPCRHLTGRRLRRMRARCERGFWVAALVAAGAAYLLW